MNLANFLNKIFKEDGFILIDSDQNRFIIGKPIKEKPIELKLFKKNLNYKLLFYPDLYFGEAYMDGSLKIENGSLTEFLEISLKNIGKKDVSFYSKILNRIRGMYNYFTNINKIINSKKNVSHHYDIQKNKIDHIIKKLDIKTGQKVLDIGSGWGALAIDIAQKTGAYVTGITLSKNQYEYSTNKIKEVNLENKVEFKLLDYRNLNDKFDRIVSVGMFEHVGKKFYSTYFNQVFKLLQNDGISLIHTIGSVNPPRDPQPWISKYIFPGGYTPSLSELAKPIEDSGLILSDLEVLRMHYSHTLRHWKERFLSKKDVVLEMFDERFLRMWEFYLASCELVFKWSDQVVFQLQLTKDITSAPNTRDYIYQS